MQALYLVAAGKIIHVHHEKYTGAHFYAILVQSFKGYEFAVVFFYSAGHFRDHTMQFV